MSGRLAGRLVALGVTGSIAAYKSVELLRLLQAEGADVAALAKPVLRHRLVVNFAAESEGITADSMIDRLLAATPTKEDELTSDARFKTIFAS